MTLLKVQTLGVPVVRYQEKRLKFRSRKALVLLIYLAVEPGTHSREKLIDLLWSQSDSQQGRVSLRTVLSQVRQALRVTGSPGIVATHDLVRLDSERPLQLDLNLITAALQPEATATDWQKAITASRGPFLEGLSLADAPGFDEWVSWQREHWHSQLEHLFQRLTIYQLDRGEGEKAIQMAGQWVEHSSLNETAYHCLMEAQARTGNRTAALQTYQQCEHALKADLDIAPGPEISALAERIRQGELRKLEPESASPFAQRPTRFPFVGRAMEYSQLVTALRTAAQGTTTVTAVMGTAGMGKTQLIEAFLDGAQFDRAGVDILRGRAYEMGGRLPYQPLVAAFRARLEQENAPEDLLDDVWLAALSQLFPELRVRYPDLPLPLTGGADFVRARLFEAMAQLGRALAARQPLIIFLDDWQWAEKSSLDMLLYLSQSWAETDTPLMLVLTMRQEALLTTPALQEWLMGIARDVPVTRIELAALTATDIQQFVRQMATTEAGHLQPDEDNAIQQFSDWLYQETAGQPFFLHERVKMLVEQSILRPPAGDGRSIFDIPFAWQQLQSQKQLPLPPTVRQALLARQGRLSETAAALLWASAVLGRDCTFERLCQVAGMAELDGLPALQELLHGRFILENGSARRPYTFAHDYIREVAYTEAGEARRRLFHRRAVAALEQAEASPAELAFHALAAQLDEPAFRYSVAAGDAAKQAHAYTEALVHYDQARELANTKATLLTVDSQLLCQLYTNRGRVLELRQQNEAAQANYQEMLELAEARHDLSLKQAALTAQCIIHATHTSLFNPLQARKLGQAALALAQTLNDPTAEARALWCMMLVEFYGGGDNHKVLAYGQQALALAQELGLKELAAYVQTNMAWAYFNSEQLEAAQTANDDSRVVWQALGNLPMAADSYTMKLYMCRNTGKYDELLAVGPEALRLSRSIHNNLHEAMALSNISEAQCRQGRFGQALASIEAAAAVLAETNESWATYFSYPNLILIYLQSGALAKAEEWADKLYAFREEVMPVFLTYFLTCIARSKIARGKYQESEAILSQNLAILDEDNPAAIDMVPLFVADGHLQLALGNPEGTLARMEVVVQRLRQIGSRYYLAEAYWLQGQSWLALAKVEQAKDALWQAKAAAEEISERSILWQILASLSKLEKMRGHLAEADRMTSQAREVVAYIADHAELDELRASFLALAETQSVLAKS